MSTPNLTARRRRIAGERRRPEQSVAEPQTETPLPAREARVESKQTKPPRIPRTGNQWPLFAGAAALAAILVTASLWLGLATWSYPDVREADRVESAERGASAAAERAATAALSFKHDTLDADLEAATSFMTPEYAKVFTETFDTYVRPNAPGQHAEVVAKVLATAVVAADEDRAEILVYVDQTTTNNVNPQPSLALNRTTFDMVKRDGTWLVDSFQSY